MPQYPHEVDARQLAQLRNSPLLGSRRPNPYAAPGRIPLPYAVMEHNQDIVEPARAQSPGNIEVEVSYANTPTDANAHSQQQQRGHDPLNYMSHEELIELVRSKERQQIQLQTDLGILQTQLDENNAALRAELERSHARDIQAERTEAYVSILYRYTFGLGGVEDQLQNSEERLFQTQEQLAGAGNRLNNVRYELATSYTEVLRNNAGWNEAFNRAEALSHELVQTQGQLDGAVGQLNYMTQALEAVEVAQAQVGNENRDLVNEVNSLRTELRESRDQTDQADAKLVDSEIKAQDLQQKIDYLQREVDVKENELKTRAPITTEKYESMQQNIKDLKRQLGEANKTYAGLIQDGEKFRNNEEYIKLLESKLEIKDELVRNAYAAIYDARHAFARDIVEEVDGGQETLVRNLLDEEAVRFGSEVGDGNEDRPESPSSLSFNGFSETPGSSCFNGFSEASCSPRSETNSLEWGPFSPSSEEEDGSASLANLLVSPQYYHYSPYSPLEHEPQVSGDEELASPNSPEYHPNSPVLSPPDESQLSFEDEGGLVLPLPAIDEEGRDQTESTSPSTVRGDTSFSCPEQTADEVSGRQNAPNFSDRAVAALRNMQKRPREEFEQEAGHLVERERASKRRGSGRRG